MSINLARLSEYQIVAVDVETTGLHWYRDKLFGVALAVYDGHNVQSQYFDLRERPMIRQALSEQLPKAKLVINHNLKFDALFLANEGVQMPLDRIECTSVLAALINEHEPSFSLDALCKKYINKQKEDIWKELADMFGGAPTRGAQIKNLHRAPSALAARYAAPDPALALELYLWQLKEIERQGLEKIRNLERRLLPVLIQIEQQGIRVDEELANRRIQMVDRKVAEAQHKLNKLAGFEVNVNSAPQMRKLFKVEKISLDDDNFEWRAGGVKLDTTEGGEGSLDKGALMTMRDLYKDERAALVLTIRRLLKGKSFLKDHIVGHAVRGRVYPNYNQTKNERAGVGPGRLSIDDPALQQIPMHDRDVAELVRECFLPEKGHKWVCADWKQFEFRWFAHYVNDPAILKIYRDNPDADFHQTTADITGISRDRKYAGDTANAKQINLGLVFGMGQGEMAYNMGMEYTSRYERDRFTGKIIREWKEAGDAAKAVFNKYHSAIPGIKALLSQASSIAKSRGFVRTKMGRHIRFPGGKFTHKAGGLVFQGTSADCMKLKMIELFPICKREGWVYLLSVHDEHDVSVPAKAKGVKNKLARVLEDFGDKSEVQCRVPIRSDIAFGDNWWDACK